MKQITIFLLFLISTSCALQSELVKDRATMDLNCAREDIEVSTVPVGEGYIARGCQRSGNYRLEGECKSGWFEIKNCKAVRY